MRVLQIISFLILTITIIVGHADKDESCPRSSCGNASFGYPFKRDDIDPSDNCSYVNLACNRESSAPIVFLPYAGEFYVRYYATGDDNIEERGRPYIQLYDPDNCLMRSLMNSYSNLPYYYFPFNAIKYDNYTFYRCPKDTGPIQTEQYSILPVECLTEGYGYSTFAVVSRSPEVMLALNCSSIGTWLLPAENALQFEMNPNDDLYLSWNYTPCLACEEKQPPGPGGFYRSGTLHSKSFDVIMIVVVALFFALHI